MRVLRCFAAVLGLWAVSACGSSGDIQFGEPASGSSGTVDPVTTTGVGSGVGGEGAAGVTSAVGVGGASVVGVTSAVGVGGASVVGVGGGSAVGVGGASTVSTGPMTATTGVGGQPPVYPPGTLGGTCDNMTLCQAGKCCQAPQCAGTCMKPCFGPNDCPMGTGCAHGYCLFACMNNDADCKQPGFTCQHNDDLCEGD